MSTKWGSEFIKYLALWFADETTPIFNPMYTWLYHETYKLEHVCIMMAYVANKKKQTMISTDNWYCLT